MIRFGIPCRVTTVDMNNYASSSAENVDLQGTKYTYFDIRSTNIAIASYPLLVRGKCVMISIVHSSNT